MRRMSERPRSCGGFTLVEAVVVMVITSILAAAVAVFIQAPVQAYFDGVRRADLVDTADGALRRMGRDLQGALPNSVRISGNFIEFLPMLDAGRYRADPDPVTGGNILDFSSASDTSFDVLGAPVNVASGNSIVVYNLGQSGADAYEGSSRRAASAPFGSVQTVTFAPGGAPFPFASPASRFQVIGTPVTYECAPDAANPSNGVLRRYWGYPIQSTQPASAATLNGLAGVSSAVAAGQVAGCVITYSSQVLQRNGMVRITLSLSKGGETIDLLEQISVLNTP